ncbi:MAG: hypothetical protein JNJ54_26720 [Myxococcaceae bacterium]|nr:hypothetical protein [Myxococcaceae bacterium]
MHLTRRQLMVGGAGAVAASSLARADVPVEKPTIVLVYLDGGYNAFFSAADCYVPKGLYGCGAGNVRDVGNGVVVDASTMGTLPDPVLQKMATVGVAHRTSGHDFALQYAWFDQGRSVPLMLADALGGTAPFRCVHFGQAPARGAPHRAVNGVAMTAVPDLAAAIALVSNQSVGAGRGQTARALEASLAYGATRYQHSPTALKKTWEGTHSLINALRQPPPPGIDWNEIAQAYGIAPTDTSAVTFTSHLAGAELMIRAGADVVCVTSSRVRLGGDTPNWDTHGDGSGDVSREMMRTGILPSLEVFLARTLALQGRNVVTLLWGDFARIGGNSPTASEHANGVSATVWGKYVRQGTTGRFDPGNNAGYRLPMGTPGYPGLWAYLTAAARAPGTPWGQNPHTALL